MCITLCIVGDHCWPLNDKALCLFSQLQLYVDHGVYFVSYRDECYHEAEFTVSGLLGEEPVVITVKGYGSYDEKYRDLLNLVIEPEPNT